jgi:hypothetical protein
LSEQLGKKEKNYVKVFGVAGFQKAGLWIRIHLNPDPDPYPAFFLNPDPV